MKLLNALSELFSHHTIMIVLRSNNQLYIVFTFFDEGYFLGNTSIVYDIIGGILHVFNVEKHILKKFIG